MNSMCATLGVLPQGRRRPLVAHVDNVAEIAHDSDGRQRRSAHAQLGLAVGKNGVGRKAKRHGPLELDHGPNARRGLQVLLSY